MKFIKSILILFVAIVLLPGVSVAQQPPDVAAKMRQANADIESMVIDIAALCQQPGFLGFLRSEIAKSKNRENIIELDKFLDRASKQKNMPPGLANLKNKNMNAKGRLKASGIWSLESLAHQGYDLYLPVEAHRQKWKGGKDFLVAVSPVDDEKDVKQFVAYQVRDGKRVFLDPKTPPDIPVLAVALCEHRSHEAFQIPQEPIDSSLPKMDFIGKEAPDKPVKQEPGNSFWGIRRWYFRDDKESWLRGDPEMDMQMYQVRGTECLNVIHADYWSIIYKCDDERRWCTIWYPPGSNYCVQKSTLEGPKYNVGKHACRYFDYNYGRSLYLYIYENDGGSLKTSTFYLDGRRCINARFSGDDYVDSGRNYITNFGYNSDYRQDLGNAIVLWYKIY